VGFFALLPFPFFLGHFDSYFYIFFFSSWWGPHFFFSGSLEGWAPTGVFVSVFLFVALFSRPSFSLSQRSIGFNECLALAVSF